VHAGTSPRRDCREKVSGGDVAAGAMQAEGEKGGFDDENDGFLGCEASGEIVSKVERMGLEWSRENNGAAKMSTPKGTVRETKSFFSSHQWGGC